MENTKTEQYERGMQAINNFYSMLYKAMKEALPTAQFSRNGAYGWRGYQINQYEDLAPNQYYCEIYPSNTGITKDLRFQESYKNPTYIPTDKYEAELGIKSGRYCYPFQISLDLYRARFFMMDVDEQFSLLENFVKYGAEQGLLWQHSTARTQRTDPKFLKGSQVSSRRENIKLVELQQVGFEFMEAWKTQHDLFIRLIAALTPYKPINVITEKEWIRMNAHPRHFNFRGLFMNSGKLLSGEFDIRWLIYFEKPELLRCFTSQMELIDDLNLVNNDYFDLPENQKDKELTSFIKKCLDRF